METSNAICWYIFRAEILESRAAASLGIVARTERFCNPGGSPGETGFWVNNR